MPDCFKGEILWKRLRRGTSKLGGMLDVLMRLAANWTERLDGKGNEFVRIRKQVWNALASNVLHAYIFWGEIRWNSVSIKGRKVEG